MAFSGPKQCRSLPGQQPACMESFLSMLETLSDGPIAGESQCLFSLIPIGKANLLIIVK